MGHSTTFGIYLGLEMDPLRKFLHECEILEDARTLGLCGTAWHVWAKEKDRTYETHLD